MFRTRWWALAAAAGMLLAGGAAAKPYVVTRPLSEVRFRAVRQSGWVHAAKVPADVVCNANFYWEHRPLGLIVKDGRIISHGMRNKPPRTALVVQKINGRQRVRILEVYERRGRIYTRSGRLDHVQTLVQAGPRLVAGGSVVVDRRRQGFRADVARRTHHVGIGLTGDNMILVVGEENVTLTEFARTFVRLGARDAMNMDGGHSATLAVGRRVRVGSGHILAGLAINTPKGRKGRQTAGGGT